MAEISEHPDILRLIALAKTGDDDAYNELYFKYEKLLHGGYLRKFITQLNYKSENDDINSIMNILFVESVNTYSPEKSKFITHLINRIKFKFLTNFLNERFISFSNNSSNEKMVKKLMSTQVDIRDDLASTLKNMEQSAMSKPKNLIVYELFGYELNSSLKEFTEIVLPSVIKSIQNEEHREIFKNYAELILDNEDGSIVRKLQIKMGKSPEYIKKAIRLSTATLKNVITIKTIYRG